MQMPVNVLIGTVFGLLASFLFAVQMVIFKANKEEISATVTNTVKMWVALGFMFVVAFLPFRTFATDIPLETIFILAVSVLFGAALGDLAYINSQNRVGVSVAFPITHSYPIITYIIAIGLGEAFLIVRMTGVIMAVVGVIIVSNEQPVVKDPNDVLKDTHDRVGLALAVLAAVMLAIATILIQIGVEGIDPIDGNLFRMFFGSIAMIPIFVASRLRGNPLPTKRATKKIAIASLFGFSFGSLFFVESIAYAGATIAAVVGSVSPLFALPLSISHLKEKVDWKIAIGTLVTAVGVVLAVI